LNKILALNLKGIRKTNVYFSSAINQVHVCFYAPVFDVILNGPIFFGPSRRFTHQTNATNDLEVLSQLDRTFGFQLAKLQPEKPGKTVGQQPPTLVEAKAQSENTGNFDADSNGFLLAITSLSDQAKSSTSDFHSYSIRISDFRLTLPIPTIYVV